LCKLSLADDALLHGYFWFIDRVIRLVWRLMSKMNAEAIITFLDLMETLSFNRTAERLGLTQSTVSARIANLESGLNTKLFVRSRSGTTPTAAGTRFQNYAETMNREWNAAKRATQINANNALSMRIGIQTDLAANHIGEWVLQIRREFPEAAINIELDYSGQMCRDILSGDMDCAVLFTPRQALDLHFEEIGVTQYRMVSSYCSKISDLTANQFHNANYAPAFARAQREALPEGLVGPVTIGQNIAVCGLLQTIGGAAYVLAQSALELVASKNFDFVSDAQIIEQPVYFCTHIRNRPAKLQRRIAALAKQRFRTAETAT
jgi:LysR family transcriptional regulator, flagellar master operon regulator